MPQKRHDNAHSRCLALAKAETLHGFARSILRRSRAFPCQHPVAPPIVDSLCFQGVTLARWLNDGMVVECDASRRCVSLCARSRAVVRCPEWGSGTSSRLPNRRSEPLVVPGRAQPGAADRLALACSRPLARRVSRNRTPRDAPENIFFPSVFNGLRLTAGRNVTGSPPLSRRCAGVVVRFRALCVWLDEQTNERTNE